VVAVIAVGAIEELQAADPEWVGPYRVAGRLKTGGMAQVYLACSPGGRAVAIKVVRPEMAAHAGFRTRFAREVTAARGVSGVFTAAVVDADPDAELPWMATAYIDGPSLADAVQEQGPLPPALVLSLAAGLAEGLQAIHRAGLVHRDLKPSNVLLASDGPRVIDFGISWASEGLRLTDAGRVVGSPGFLSPEQARGRKVGPASDVFSLGAVLAYAATGSAPSPSMRARTSSPTPARGKATTAPPPRPTTTRPTSPQAPTTSPPTASPPQHCFVLCIG
jgi:serine/threonine protein kinase